MVRIVAEKAEIEVSSRCYCDRAGMNANRCRSGNLETR